MSDLTGLVTELTREILDAEGKPSDDLAPETALYGKGGRLDSMGIVSLIVAIEQAIEDELGLAVSLADERALSQNQGPYRTLASLTEYTEGVIARAS